MDCYLFSCLINHVLKIGYSFKYFPFYRGSYSNWGLYVKDVQRVVMYMYNVYSRYPLSLRIFLLLLPVFTKIFLAVKIFNIIQLPQ